MAFPDDNRFAVGVNLPWVGYGTDIGASAWFPAGGLSAQADARALLTGTFARLERDGISLVRTFLLCDARSGVRFDDDGVPTGLDDFVFPDLDALAACARRHHVQLIPVLLDFHLCKPARMTGGVQLGGRSRVITDPVARAAFVDLVVRPIVERYREEQAIVAWDVMNEPEWCLDIDPGGDETPVTFDALQQFLDQAVRSIQVSTRQPVTIGCAHTRRLDLVRPLGLDFYQVHWYERFGWRAIERPVVDLDLDRPVLLGEFPGRSALVVDVLDRAKSSGYEGALVWSVLSDDDQSAYPPDLVEWHRAHAAGRE